MPRGRGASGATAKRPQRQRGVDTPAATRDQPATGAARGTRVTTRSGRGLSPVVGVALLVAILVILAAVTAGLLLGFEGALHEPAPAAAVEQDYSPQGVGNTDNRPYVNLTYRGGPDLDGHDVYVVDDAGNEVQWSAIWTAGPGVEAGQYVHVDGFGSDGALQPICEAGQEYKLVHRREDGSTFVLWSYEVPSDPPDRAWC